jgi:hypothetical protein
MPTKPLDRLMFVQGGLCFFCKQPLPKAEASVEHLLAGANGGSSKDENCVACCKAVNALLGSMSLKEKFQVVLNQKGQFKCPNGAGAAISNGSSAKRESSGSDSSLSDHFELVVENLKSRKSAKPTSLKTLASTIRSLKKGMADHEVEAVIEQLKSSAKISLTGEKVNYTL